MAKGPMDDRYRLLIESITDYAIYMLDTEGGITSWNPGARRFKGYEEDEILGENFSRFYTAEDRARGLPQQALARAVAEGRFEAEGWRIRKDGTRLWAHVVIDPVRTPDGRLLGFAKITRDLTERLEQEQELLATREALFQAQKIEAVGQLTGGVAHDFNNLLAAILGSLELVRKRSSHDPRVTPLLDNAIQAAQRGAALTERMLAFARKQELKIETVDLPDLVGGMLEFLRRTIGGQVDVDVSFPPNLPPVLSDPCQLEAAILNLAVNARDAMPSGGRVSITARRELQARATSGLPAGDYVVLSVADNGTGMAPETLARATEPFFTTKGVGKGTGLGLSMVHGLAAQAGGAVLLDSELGRGTTVHVYLPVADGATPQQGLVVAPSESPPVSTGKSTILVVDDDELVLVNTAAMLDDLGHTVIAAGSGAEALSTLRDRRDIDLIVTDELMPGMRGSELAAVVRQARPDLPVLLATGYGDDAPDSALRAGLPRLSKPFSQAQLEKAVAAATA